MARAAKHQNHSPSLLLAIARVSFFALTAGFVLAALGWDPVALAGDAGRWLVSAAP